MAICCPTKKYHCKDLCASCYHKQGNARRYKDPAFREETKRRSRQWVMDNPERAYKLDANKHLKAHYGITLNDYEAALSLQGGVCALCKLPETIRSKKRVSRLAVDHCHKTGAIRGLLCFKCNTSIALFEKNPEILEAIKIYLGDNNV